MPRERLRLVDVVFSGGTEFQTFFALGRYPKGDGQFGHATWTGSTSAALSNDPVSMCVPWDSTPVRFSDPDIKLSDMNGDGLADIVRVRKGDIRYWPGRGNGLWGTGKVDDCAAGTFGQARNIAMTSSPQYSDIQGDSLRLDDVNGDGLDDLVQVRFDGVDVWLNVDGISWTQRHIIAGTPASPSFANRVRLVDANGSGTRDILWGDGLHYKYIDLAGGQRPWMLTRVANGLGKTTDLEYTTSTALMLTAERDGKPWTSKAPMPLHVVSRVTESDNLDIVGRQAGRYVTEYTYRDPVYDGRQREFRGFASATVKRIGDENSPTSLVTTSFLLGQCKDEEPSDGIDPCSPENRWRDNGREALKGLPLTTETFDELGTYLSSVHNTYRLRRLYAGLDGREVRHAFVSTTDTFLYDTGPFAQSSSPISLTDVDRELVAGTVTADLTSSVTMRSAGGKRAHTRVTNDVDFFGNATSKTAYGCIEGCTPADESITSVTLSGHRDDDASGWRWRTVESYVTGSAHTEKRNHQFMTYTLAGDPLEARSELFGTLPLDRANDAGKTSAPSPADASEGIDEPITILVSHEDRDAFGNLEKETGPNGRCRFIGHQEPYAALATSETIRAGTVPLGESCGNVALAASATYDRGLGLVTHVVDLHGEPTGVAYDAFGRLSSLTRPSPYLTADELPAPSDFPSVKIEYFLPADWTKTPYSIVHTMTQDGIDHDVDEYQRAWGYVDGVGRALVTLAEADPNASDGGNFVANGLVDYDRKGAPRRAFLPFFFSGDPTKFPLDATPTSLYGSQRYDAFGRQLETFGLDGTLTLRSVYHALSQDKWDAADVAPGPHQGTPAAVATDGHGRATVVTERIHSGAAIEARETRTTYVPTGEVETVTRHRVNAADPDVLRWMRYDSLGRRVLNAEPNVTKNFHPEPRAPGGTMRSWRYAYNDAGDLVGTSDARGCGANYGYDAAGRILFEDYSPCTPEQEDYSPPALAARTGIEVLYHYDDVEPADAPPSTAFLVASSLYLGRLAWVADRAARTLTRYDGRGRVTGVARRVARPGPPALALADRYAPRWYVRKANFDAADRPIRESTGASVSELVGAAVPALHEGHDATRLAGDNASVVTTAYTARGTVKRVGGSYRDLVGSVFHDADGRVTETRYADVATTTTSFSYDNRRRLRSVQTYRGPPGIWTQPAPSYQPAPSFGSSPPTTFQLLLQDEDFEYDAVDNPTEIRDWRLVDEWLTGAKPVTRKIQYDDLYRVTQVDHQYAGGDDAWTSPFAAENAGEIDPRRTAPSPHVSFDKRVLRQTFQYDWLGNTAKTTDDANGFYDRSLGVITNDVTGAKPYQLKAASNEATAASSTRRGHLSAVYDDAGNLVRLAVVRKGACLPAGANCSQLFAYDWDEVGRLVDARRWDVDAATAASLTASSPLPASAPAAHLRHRYDSSDQRVIKTASNDETLLERSTLYIFGSLELRGAIPTVDGAYEHASLTEVPYLVAHGVRLGRVVFEPAQVPALDAGKTHVFLELGDHLGSTSAVLDKSTSELVERSTYETYGAAESDYRPERWAAFREDYRFTGKEEDVEVGLAYFGKRFLSAYLGRWTSADPLAVHVPGEVDLNAYAYVHGQFLRAIDPVGLQDQNNTPAPAAGVSPPPPPVPGSPQAVFEDGARIGRQYGAVFGDAEAFLRKLEETGAWNKMSPAEREDTLTKVQSTLDALPRLPGQTDPELAEAASKGFDAGTEGGIESARAKAVAIELGVAALLAAGPAAAERVAAAGGRLLQTMERLGAELPAGSLGSTVGAAERGALESGKLTAIGPRQWESSGGLRYGYDPQYGNRVRHVLNHAADIPTRPGAHGVFDAGRKGTLSVVDDAWRLAQQGGPGVRVEIEGAATKYTIDMGRRVGYVGGQVGAATGNPAASHVRLIVRNGQDVITAFPVRP